MDESMDQLSIEIESTTQDSVKAVDLLIQRLDKLRVSLQNVVKESGNFSQLKKDLENISKDVSTKTSTQKMSSLGDLGSKEQQLRQLGITGDLKDSSYAKLTSTIKTTNSELSKYVLNNNKVLTVSEKTKNGLKNVRVSLKEVGDEANNASDKSNKFGNVFSSIGAKITGTYLILRKVTDKVADFIKESANYEEALNLFMVTMGDNAQDAYKWVTKFSNALYLDPSSVMQYMGSFNSLTKGLGVGAENSYLMSRNLTQLTYDLASFKNLDFDTAFRKLQSAMSGEIEPLRNVGVALSQATLEQLAYSLGIEKSVKDMTEAEKAQLRYIQIMKSSTEWQTDMGRTLMTPANALRVIKQQFILLARAIGNVFIPILMAAVPYIMVITQALTKLAQKIANFFGYQLQDIDYSRIGSGLGDIASGIGDVGDEAGKSAKKLNTMLAPFDELNVVQQESKKNGAGDDLGFGGDLGVILPEYDALAGLTDKFKNNMEDARKNLKKLLPVIIAIGGAFALWKISGPVSSLLGFFGIGTKIGGGTSGFQAALPSWKTLLKGMAELAVVIGGVVLFVEALGLLTRIPGFKKNITEGVDVLVKTFQGIGKILIPLAVMTALMAGLGALGGKGVAAIAIGLADIAIVIAGLEILVTAIGLFTKIPHVNELIDDGLKSIKKVFTNLSDLAGSFIVFAIILTSLGATGGAGAAMIGVGLLLFAEVIVGLQVVLAAIGGLQQIPGFSWIIGEGGKALTQIGNILGSFAGSIITGFAGQITSILPKIGEDLAGFGINATPFFDALNNVDESSTKAVKNLAEAILILTAADILEGLTSWFTGKTSLTDFGKELEAFAPHFVKYSNTVKGIDAGVVEASAKAAKAIGKMAKELPNNGGVLGLIMGENDLATFGKMLPEFGKNLKKYSDNVAGINSDIVTSSANAAKAIAELSTKLPNNGGLLGVIMGENDLKKFGEMLPSFGKNLKKYSDNVKDVDPKIVEASANSAKAISKLANGLPNQGGVVSWFTGDNKLSTFGKELSKFGEYMSDYYNSISQISTNKMNDVTASIKSLVSVLKDIKNNSLNSTMSAFAKSMANSVGDIATFFAQAFPTWKAWDIGWNFGATLGNAIKQSISAHIGSTLSISGKSKGGSLAEYSIRLYANGGYPEQGEFFFANEQGPEMIGRIGNKSAVANNDQITESITNALLTALNNYDFGGSKGPTTIYIGNKKVYEGYGDYVNSENDRYGTNTIRI